MKALILVGGYGTRLRPLTLSVPKPLIDFCNKSIVEHQISALVKVGVTHVVLAVAYQPEAMLEALKKLELKYAIRISCSQESEPLGTAGPIALAADILKEGAEDEFFVCNSDVVCRFPFQQMLQQHKIMNAEATILVTRVEDPSAFGVVVRNPAGKVLSFVEKPETCLYNSVNAGLYVLKKSVIDRIQVRPTSIEKEIFPAIAASGGLYSTELEGYWADIGRPADFLKGVTVFLEAMRSENPSALNAGPHVTGNVIIDPGAKIGAGSIVGPNVTIAAGCHIGRGCRISNSAIMSGVTIDDSTYIEGSIVGWQSRIGKWIRIQGLSVVGEDVQVSSECFLNGVFILPHKSITASIPTSGTIVM